MSIALIYRLKCLNTRKSIEWFYVGLKIYTTNADSFGAKEVSIIVYKG